MRLSLHMHPDSRCDAVQAVEVEMTRPAPGELVLRYVVTGALGDVIWPRVLASERKDWLWQKTCFEVFVAPEGDDAYFEFNLSPSTQWAAYDFDAHRQGSRDRPIDPPRIAVAPGAERYELRASCPVPADLARARVGLTAVIEETNRNISFWALSFPPGKADFHDVRTFAADLPAAELS